MNDINKKFCVCLSHDVDRTAKTFQFLTHTLKSLKNVDMESAMYQVRSLFHKSHYWNFDKIMEIERRLGVKSTFYFLNETYPFHPFEISSWRLSLGYYDIFEPQVQAIIRELDREGWEIGLHGSYLSFNNEDLLKKEKNELEKVIGHTVMGVRQHYLNLNNNTWRLQANAGFVYDASFGFTDRIGFRENRFHPFKPIEEYNFYVVPLALMDSCIMRTANSIQEAIKIIALAEEKSASLVLNWHQRMFNEKEFPGYKEMYVRLIEECKKRNAYFLTIGELISNLLKSQ